MNRLGRGLPTGLLAFVLAGCSPIQPQFQRIVVPGYPELARQARVEGEVVVAYDVAGDGSVSRATVLSGSHPLLDPPLLEAVRQWRFDPASLPGPDHRKVTFRLRLEEGKTERQWSVFKPPDQIEIVARVELMGPRS